MTLNFKKVPKSGWVLLGTFAAIMIGAVIFKPTFTGTAAVVVTIAVCLFLLYTVAKYFMKW